MLGILCVQAAFAQTPTSTKTSWRPIVIPARDLTCSHGAAPQRIGLFSCSEACAAIPWQLDERDSAGDYVLDQGPRASSDGDHGLIDNNDDLTVMWSDLGTTPGAQIPGHPECIDEVAVQLGDSRRLLYAARFREPAPRALARYVEYDVAADRMQGRVVDLTFGKPTPRGLALRSGPAAGLDLLDRLKIRAYARFFGIFPLYRDEDDILSVYEAWRIGPIRVIRRERKWVRLAFGFRTPYIRTETMFYRDFVQLPVSLRLNFPPASLLHPITIWAALDFVNLEGWRLWIPGGRPSLNVGSVPPDVIRDLDALDDVSMIALEGADATFALVLKLGPTLRSLSRTVFYREGTDPDEPEDFPGGMPAIGFRLGRWDDVDRGAHRFVAESYALPAGYDPAAFAEELKLNPILHIRPRRDLPTASSDRE